MSKKAHRFFSYKTIFTSLCFLSITTPPLLDIQAIAMPQLDESVTYTMNFRNIAIVEYIRFVSRISKINFIFNENDLTFPVTLVSDQPVSAKNLFSALAQVLEVNGFSLSEKEGSILITKNPGASQLAPINQLQAPLITRIFKIENINLGTLTQIVKSIVSKGALVESVQDTNQLIVTDTGPNLDRLGLLIQDLDTAGSHLKIFTYKVKNQSSSSLAESLKEMIKPFQGGNSYLVIAQNSNNQLLVITTPYLIQQTEQVLTSLDVPPASIPLEDVSGNVFLYNPKYKKAQEISSELLLIAETLKKDGPATASLVAMIENAKTPVGSGCLIFTGSQASYSKIGEFLAAIDNKDLASTVFIYHIKNLSPTALEALLNDTASRYEDKGDPENIVPVIDSMVYVEKTNTLIFSGPMVAIDRIKQILVDTDVPAIIDGGKPSYAIYELKNVPGGDIIDELKNLESTFNKDDAQELIESVNAIRWLKSNNSLLISGSPKVISTLEGFISKLDVAHSKFAPAFKNGFVIYHLKGKNGSVIADQLHVMASNISANNAKSLANQNTLRSAKYISDTNSIMLTGDDESIRFAEDIIAKLDSAYNTTDLNYAFFAVKDGNGAEITKKLHNFADTLTGDNTQDLSIKDCLKGAKYIPESQTILMHGTNEAIQFSQQLAQKISEGLFTKNARLMVYNLKAASGESVVSQLHEMSFHIKDDSSSTEDIKSCLETARFLAETNSIMLTGSEQALSFTQTIIEKMDVAPIKGSQNTFYLYKLQTQQGNVVIERIQDFAQRLPANSTSDKNVITSINHLEWIKESNAILISGNQATIDRVSALIAQYDALQTASANKGDFLIYSPSYLSLDALEQSLEEYAVALKQSGLSDPNLIETINTAKSVPSANHLVFTGNSESISKVKEILQLIDQSEPVSSKQQIGQTTFYVYTLKNLTPEQFESSMRSFVTSLSKFNSADTLISKSVGSMQYLKETNSFLFTGNSQTLDKIAEIANKIDVGTGSSATGAVTYEIYTPQHQSGDDLIAQMCQFAQGLADTGIQDKSLYDTINNIKWISKSKSMIITGTPDAIMKVQDLLKKFDIPGGAGNIGTKSGFMVYKLQYHAGTEIQSALNKLAPTFASQGPNSNPGLSAAIASIQWIQATNSLVASGDSDNLEKLKTLISEIDMPLKQVFIEVLVVETDTANTQNFGLQWFGKGKLKNQLGFGTGNFGGANPLGNSPTYNLPNFSGAAASVPPITNNIIPFYGNQSNGGTAGFDLGVIGDVLFHKGQSFVSLGSLVNALQADADSTIVMNPKIISQDNQNSTIFIGQNIPFLGSNVTNSAANTTVTQNIEYRDVGINLSITPKLGDDDVITLEITYNMSAQTANTAGGQGGFNGIQTTQTNMTTRVHVPDQHFVVLSGMLSENKTRYKTGIPCLGGLPLIGVAFSDNERNVSKSNTLIFIRPCIVHDFDELQKLTENQENKYRDMLDRHQDKEDFDEAINLVKEPTNE